ncbi:MAG: tripartite tricarboxylate transporter TctB family protein [Lachnospiraceae bacterium]|nr:tripartite tricarboxylate transporter TctB family protein [Lachnospiraceae bacterium]
MLLKEGKAEIWLGGFFTVFGILLLAVIIPSQIKYVDGGYPQPRFFPDLISGIILVLGISLCIQGIRKKKKDSEDQETYSFKWKETRLVLITLGIIILYVASMYFIPYLPATIVATGVLVALYGQKKIWKIILTAALVPVIIYVGMTYGLMIRLP